MTTSCSAGLPAAGRPFQGLRFCVNHLVEGARSTALLNRADGDHQGSPSPIIPPTRGALKACELTAPRGGFMKAQHSEVRVASGQVQAAAQNSASRFGIKVAGVWYDGLGSCPVKRGDSVAIAYTEKGRFKNIVEARVSEPSEKAVLEVTSRDRFVAYSVALKSATAMMAGAGVSQVSDVTLLAEQLAEWLLLKAGEKPAPAQAKGRQPPFLGGRTFSPSSPPFSDGDRTELTFSSISEAEIFISDGKK